MSENIKIAICDDESLQLKLITQIVASVQEEIFKNSEVYQYESVKKLLKDCKVIEFDLIIMDIQMEEMNGFDAVVELCKGNLMQDVIFITGEFELVFESIGFGPVDFIRKRSEKEMWEDMKNAFQRFYRNNVEKQELQFSTGGIVQKVRKSNILKFQSVKNYLECYIKGNETLIMRKTLSQQEEELRGDSFVRVNKGILVNLEYVEKIDIKNHWVKGKEIGNLDLTKKYEEEVLKKYMDYKMRY